MKAIELIKNILITFHLEGETDVFSTKKDSNFAEDMEDLECELNISSILNYDGMLKKATNYLIVYSNPLIEQQTGKPVPADFITRYYGFDKKHKKVVKSAYLYEISSDDNI